MLGALLGLSPALVQDRAEFREAVRLIRTNYAGYPAVRAEYEPAAWRRLQAAADRAGSVAQIRGYIDAFDDSSLWYEPSSPSGLPTTIRFGGGPGSMFASPSGASREPFRHRFEVSYIAPGDGKTLERLAETKRSSVILDLRSAGAEDVPPDATLGLLTDRRKLREPGVEVLTTRETLAAWRASPTGLPGGAATLGRMTQARPGSSLTLTPGRLVAAAPRRRFVRVAILIGRTSDLGLGRFLLLARQSSSVRLFGTPTEPLGERGVRRFALPGGGAVMIPTFRSRGAFRVVPDEDVRSIPKELARVEVDLARFRADQWCRLGE